MPCKWFGMRTRASSKTPGRNSCSLTLFQNDFAYSGGMHFHHPGYARRGIRDLGCIW
jgi:hypothetical protein